MMTSGTPHPPPTVAHGAHSVTAPRELPAALTVRDLTVRYGQRPAISGVNLDIASQRVTAVIGPSGCGKTSFLHALNRLTDLTPGCRVEGRVDLHGTDVYGDAIDVRVLRRAIGTIFQKANPFPISIADNLHLPLKELGHRRQAREKIIEDVLRRVGLWDEVSSRLSEPATKLSGGQQQRLCVARALTLEPEVLLMDEPCSALDPIATETIERLILTLREKYTVIIVTHNLAQARRVADDVAVFWTEQDVGRLIETGPAHQVLQSPRHPDTVAYVGGKRG